MRRDNKLAKIEKVVDDWLNKRSFIALDDVYDLIQNEIEALTRRNAELTAAILDYHLFHHGLRREITECAGRLCRRYAALTTTASEAK